MNKKEIIAKLLNSLTEEELIELIGVKEQTIEEDDKDKVEEKPYTHSIRGNGGNSRGKRGGKKRNRDNNEDGGGGNKRNTRNRKGSRANRGGLEGDPCRTEPMVITHNRKNYFESFIKKVESKLDANEVEELEAAKAGDKNIKSVVKDKRPSPFINVVCRVCDTEETVPANLVANPKRYRCEKCLKGIKK